MFKLLLLPLLLVSAAFAQIPAQSTNNGITLYVTETPITLPAGPPQMLSIVTVCSAKADVDGLAVSIGYGPASAASTKIDLTPAGVKSELGFCFSGVIPGQRKDIGYVSVQEVRTVNFQPPPVTPPAASASK